MCACDNGGQCVAPELGDPENTGSKFVLMGCACVAGFTGRLCTSDIDACELNGQPCYPGVDCEDLPAPANITGYKCGPCPAGYSGNGAKCTGEFFQPVRVSLGMNVHRSLYQLIPSGTILLPGWKEPLLVSMYKWGSENWKTYNNLSSE